VTAAPTTTTPATIRKLAAAWVGDAPCDIEPLSGQGFSGAPVWRVQTATGRFVLKAFAAGTAPERAAWVHGLMLHLHGFGCNAVPTPQRTAAGTTLVADGGRLWELVEFLTGGPTVAPSPAQATAALEALARAHVAAASLPDEAPHTVPGLPRRIEQARVLLDDPWRARRDRLPPSSDALTRGMRERLERAIASFEATDGSRVLVEFSRRAPLSLAMQPVFRDVWADHVFFDREQPGSVTGFIDLHAAGIDTPATDIARLLGSWTSPWRGAGGWLTRWEPAIAAYENVRPLAPNERQALPMFHASTVVLGLDNWFRWVLDDGRTFPVPAALERVDRLLDGLPEALHELAVRGQSPPWPLST
jgi:homoserine kinase type II